MKRTIQKQLRKNVSSNERAHERFDEQLKRDAEMEEAARRGYCVRKLAQAMKEAR